jgi:hypothetical protein
MTKHAESCLPVSAGLAQQKTLALLGFAVPSGAVMTDEESSANETLLVTTLVTLPEW